MYTKEYDVDSCKWFICDQEGDEIAMVENEGEADALLSHLNRG